MKILISPAKKMRSDPDTLAPEALPALLPETERLLAALRAMTPGELQALWRCSDAIAAQNLERLRDMDLRRRLTPALLSYVGLQYQYMAPGVLEQRQYDYLQTHLRILSGFYGVLRPFDGVTPYRLEMGARLKTEGARDLYAFWGDKLARALEPGDGPVVDLASREYSPGGGSPICPGASRWSPASLAGSGRTAGLWSRARPAKWPGARWSAGWRSGRSPGRRSYRSSGIWVTASCRSAPTPGGMYF